ncbi:choice-of-anchor Y domain-containing protein [Leptolyngbya sp. AN03gr2]|uniref:choice-of-anchor Y domain-containing protein n=1 Tax=unclassified Leptolyngbya TaxID=2650499 RepID=UPI003D31635D
MKHLLTATLTSTFLLISSASASALTTVLYNGAAGTTPDVQGWARPSTLGSQSLSGGGTLLDTTADFNIADGYAWTNTTLNRATGFNIRFDLQLLSESRNGSASNNVGTDTSDDRAGLSILVLSSDTRGIEFGFWTDRIWAQEDGLVKADPITRTNPATSPTGTRFSQAEGVAFDTQSSMNQFDLTILGNSYILFANGNYSVPIRTGRLRDYRPEFAAFPSLATAAYNTPNLIFIGDNTTSARGSFQLNQVAYSSTPIPFAFNPLFGFGVFGVSRLRKAIAKKRSV